MPAPLEARLFTGDGRPIGAVGDALKVTGGGGGGGDASAANQATEIAALGAPADAEATGNGSIIAILKRLRTLLGNVLLGGGEAHVGQVGGHIVVASANFTRPADTTAYAVGDLIANSTTAGAVAPLQFTVSRTVDGSFMIRRARVKKTGPSVTNAQVRLHLYKQSPAASNGDNGVWLTDEKLYLGSMDVTPDRAFTDAAKGIGVPNAGSEINGTPDVGTQLIYGLLEARAAYVPASAEVFTVTLETHQN